MPNTYGQAFVHLIFAVKYRRALLQKEWRQEVFGYMGAIAKDMGLKVMIINGVEDHVHLLIGMKPDISIADITEKVKANSSKWINQTGKLAQRFEWQRGYGYFTHSYSQVPRVANYILNQEKHHSKKTFIEEYESMLIKWEIDFDSRYVFQPLE
jgi:putative transposase